MLPSLASTVHSAGINLLDGLTVQFGLDYMTEEKWITGAPTAMTRVFTSALKVPEITYSLNLFNTKDDFYRVIARPSLVASLNETSEFFIGKTVSVAVSGINLGSVQLIDLGTYVRVTPSAISPTEARFKIEVIRSFPITDNPGTFQQALTAFKQTVNATAAVEFGKTLILSGLYEGVDTGGFSKTPGLGDTPVLDTLFNARRRTQRRDVALVLVTPRLAGVVETDTREFRGETLNRLLSLWKDYIDPTVNLDAILGAAPPPANPTFYGAQPADVHLAPVSDPDTLRAVVNETVAQLR
jgi:type II secretory pathway component GspD/PulD (secretin)